MSASKAGNTKNDELISTKKAADIMGVERETVQQLCKAKLLPGAQQKRQEVLA